MYMYLYATTVGNRYVLLLHPLTHYFTGTTISCVHKATYSWDLGWFMWG